MNDENETHKQAWEGFLNQWRWDFFLTITFREPRQPHHAIGTLGEVSKLIKARTAGNHFLGTELHVNRTLHVHGLLQSPYGADDPAAGGVTDRLFGDFFRRFGRSQVRRVRSNEAVSNYCCKYVTKGFTEWLLQV